MTQSKNLNALVVAEVYKDIGRLYTHLSEHSRLRSEYDIPEEAKVLYRAGLEAFLKTLSDLCTRIKDRTLLQIRNSIKRLAYEENGLPLTAQPAIVSKQLSVQQGKAQQSRVMATSGAMTASTSKSKADLTLNMLNAMEQEADVE